MGYPAFKIHGWGTGPIEREVATVLATRKAVGDQMDLMIDPACEYNTLGETLKVGLACDEARFFWLEDPYKDGGISAFAHRKLRQIIKTPILIGEHIRGLELHVDNIVADGTDFVRADADYDGGITGLMKIAHAAEGFGLDVEIHAPGPHHRHCMAAVRNTNYYELGLVHPKLKATKPPIYACGYSDELDAVDKNGHVAGPDRPRPRRDVRLGLDQEEPDRPRRLRLTCSPTPCPLPIAMGRGNRKGRTSWIDPVRSLATAHVILSLRRISMSARQGWEILRQALPGREYPSTRKLAQDLRRHQGRLFDCARTHAEFTLSLPDGLRMTSLLTPSLRCPCAPYLQDQAACEPLRGLPRVSHCED